MDETGKSVGSPPDPHLRRPAGRASPRSAPKPGKGTVVELIFPDPALQGRRPPKRRGCRARAQAAAAE